jgi:hypothetical protein
MYWLALESGRNDSGNCEHLGENNKHLLRLSVLDIEERNPSMFVKPLLGISIMDILGTG